MSSTNRVKSEFLRCLGDKLNQFEADLFHLIDTKDVKLVKEHLKSFKHEIDLNKKGDMGYTALQSAVLIKNKKILAALLATRRCEPIDEALVLATQVHYQEGINVFMKYINLTPITTVDEESMEEILVADGCVPPSAAVMSTLPLPMQKCAFTFPEDKRFSPDVVEDNRQSKLFSDPSDVLKKAAISEDFKTTEILLSSNHILEEPTNSGQRIDSLHESVKRLETYQALSSATYISLTAQDPIKVAFERSRQFIALGNIYPENSADFKLLSEKSSKFAVELLGLCKSSDEVKRLLLLKPSTMSPLIADHKYYRLVTAMRCNQKEFVTHTYCQHILTSIWLEGLPQWQQWGTFRQIFHVLTQAILMPIIVLASVIAPDHFFASPAKVPLNRFLYSATSYSIFVIFLFSILASSSSGSYTTSWVHCTAFILTLATWVRILANDMPFKGKLFLKSFWDAYELVMYFIFTIAFVLILFLQDFHPLFLPIGEGLMSIGFIMALTKTLQWLQLHQAIGPFIIAFSRIIHELLKLVVVLVIFFCAFSIGIYFLYRNKKTRIGEDEYESFLFSRYSGVMGALFWSVYGYGEYDYPRIVPLVNSTDIIKELPSSEQVTEWIGFGLWGMFHVSCVTIVTNMLIAFMTNTYQKIEDHCDNEWKYARTEFWMYYFEDFNRIPVPFNVLEFFKIFILWLYNKTSKKQYRPKSLSPWRHDPQSNSGELKIDITNIFPVELMEPDSKECDEYSNLMKILIERYIKKSNLEKKSSS